MHSLPAIKIIEVSKALLHEETDPTRLESLTKRIKESGVLYDPVIAAPIANEHFAVLDGANRLSVFKQLGIPHIVAQIVEYRAPFVTLRTWNHAICDPRFRNVYDKPVKRFKKGAAMNAFVRSYKGVFPFHRVTAATLAAVREEYPEAMCLVVFPRFTPSDIERFSFNEQKIPSGITRHIVRDRALRLNIPLSVLQEEKSTEEKNGWLKNYIDAKLKQNRVRYYAEPVYLFDE